MIEEVKKVKLEELNKQKAEYDKTKHAITQGLDETRDKLFALQMEQEQGITVIGNFSFLEKWITRRHEYKLFKKQSKRASELPKLISETEDELAKEETRVEQELKTSGIYYKRKEIIQEISLTENAKTLYEMGITPADAVELLESKGIQPVLSESDKCIHSHPRNYSSKSSLIGVHKTKYAPTANMIKSAKDANVKYKGTITINEVKYEFLYKSGRDTVHMSINDEVASHAYGSWDDCKYAVLIPLEDIPNEKIARGEPMDTFTQGSIELSEHTWVLCPKNEVDRLKVFNPKVHVLGYEGDNVLGFSQPFLTQLGYRAEEVSHWGWTDSESERQFRELMKREEIKMGAHTHTYFSSDEDVLKDINKAVEISKLLRDNHLITSPENIEDIMSQLSKAHAGYGEILLALGGTTVYEEHRKEPQSILGNNRQVDIFLEEMKKNGFNISPTYQHVMKRLCEVSIYNCDENNRDIVFNLPKEASMEERKTIKKLEDSLVNGSGILDREAKNVAFGNFISVAILDSIIQSQERNVSKEEVDEGR